MTVSRLIVVPTHERQPQHLGQFPPDRIGPIDLQFAQLLEVPRGRWPNHCQHRGRRFARARRESW